jgi:hypothetical protein
VKQLYLFPAEDVRLRRRGHGRVQRLVRYRLRPRACPAVAVQPRVLPRFGPDELAERAALAGTKDATHVSCMQTLTKTELVGFMELQVGSLAVQVPIRSADPGPSLPLASFEVEGDACAILIRGDSSSKAVERAMGEAAKVAIAHLSRKLLN